MRLWFVWSMQWIFATVFVLFVYWRFMTKYTTLSSGIDFRLSKGIAYWNCALNKSFIYSNGLTCIEFLPLYFSLNGWDLEECYWLLTFLMHWNSSILLFFFVEKLMFALKTPMYVCQINWFITEKSSVWCESYIQIYCVLWQGKVNNRFYLKKKKKSNKTNSGSCISKRDTES